MDSVRIFSINSVLRGQVRVEGYAPCIRATMPLPRECGQGSVWAGGRSSRDLPRCGGDHQNAAPPLERDIKAVSHKDLIVIDGAPQAADLAISAIKASDLVLIPVQPSPYDIWAASDLVELVKQRIEMTDGRLKAAFVVSRAIKNTKIGAEIKEALEGYGLPVLEARITQSVAYPSTAAAGTTVLDVESSSNAAQEVRGLAREVLSLLK